MLTLRRATEADAATVAAIWRANPVGGPLPYYYSGAAFGRPGYRLFFLDWDGRAVGTVSARPEHLGSHPCVYASDAAMDRAVRGRGLASRALAEAFAAVAAPDVHFLTTVHALGNPGPDRVFRGRHFQILYQTPWEISYLPALPRPRREPHPTSDYEEVCALVNGFYAGHAFFRSLAPDELARREDFTVLAERSNGRLVACVGVWRQQRIRRLMLVRPGPAIRAALSGVSLWNRRVDAAACNGARELAVHVLTEPAFAPGHAGAFHRLLDSAGCHRDAHCFQLAAHPACPIASEARRRLRFGFHSLFTVLRPAGRTGELAPVHGPVYHDCSWL
jgi:hypothetical protein